MKKLEGLATEKQKELMIKLDIKFNFTTSKQEAHDRISEELEQRRECRYDGFEEMGYEPDWYTKVYQKQETKWKHKN